MKYLYKLLSFVLSIMIFSIPIQASVKQPGENLTVKSKKGLQFGESMPDALDLGISHCLFNLDLTEFLLQTGDMITYTHHDQVYYFNRGAFDHWGVVFSQLQDAGVCVSAEFLLSWNNSLLDYIHPDGRVPGHTYYAWNVKRTSIKNTLSALFACIAGYFDGTHDMGYIYNYIIGNEVNAYNEWYYSGHTDIKYNAELYADAFNLVYQQVHRINKNAHVSICLEHTWGQEFPGRVHAGKDFLSIFAKRLKKYDSPVFALSYHPYSEPLTESEFWKPVEDRVKQNINSPCITMQNIDVLTEYIKEKYGEETRVLLTEQGFSSHGTNGEVKQATALAYAYYKAEFNDMIDCIIFRCQADSAQEIQSHGLAMGLWTEGMGQAKLSRDVYKNMDRAGCENYTQVCKDYLGIQDWSELISDYDNRRFK